MNKTGYTVADEESYYDDQNEIVLVNGEQKRLVYFFDSNGIHIKGLYLLIFIEHSVLTLIYFRF